MAAAAAMVVRGWSAGGASWREGRRGAEGMGALAVECRVDDVDTEHLLQSVLDDAASRAAASAERALLAALPENATGDRLPTVDELMAADMEGIR